jgi:hypothetical protein
MSECLSEAWRGYARQVPSARILMGGFYVVIGPAERISSFLQTTVLLLPSRVQPQGSSPAVARLRFCSLVVHPCDESTHNTPKIFGNASSTRLITFSLFRLMATNCFAPSLHPLPPPRSPDPAPSRARDLNPLSPSPRPRPITSLKSVSYTPAERVSPLHPFRLPTFLSLPRQAWDLSSITDR